MSNWKIKPKKKDNKFARVIKKKQREVIKIKEEVGCNGESARKSVSFNSEQERKRMAQLFFRSR